MKFSQAFSQNSLSPIRKHSHKKKSLFLIQKYSQLKNIYLRSLIKPRGH